LIDRAARGSEVRLEAHRVGDPQELLVGFQKLEKIAKRLESPHRSLTPRTALRSIDDKPRGVNCNVGWSENGALSISRLFGGGSSGRSRRYRNCSDNDKPDEDSSGHEIHIQALEALSACCHDCRYGQKAPSDNKRDKGFQCEHQRPALNCPKKIRG
jgi:hypothetical protein